MINSENLRGFNLFIDLDDVLISSHNEMNDDLKKRYPKLDWAIGADLLTIVNENSKALKEMPDERAKRAYDAYIELRADVQRDGMRYDEMERRFEMMHQYHLDCTHTTEENDFFHYIVQRLKKSFIERERFLDLRDTRLYLDNKEDVDKCAVHYENYYTRDRLMESERDQKIPAEVAKLAQEPIFDQPLKVLSHMNGKNEVAAKTAFLKENYPDTLFTPLFFHENNVFDKEFRRPRYSKAKYVMNELGMDKKAEFHPCSKYRLANSLAVFAEILDMAKYDAEIKDAIKKSMGSEMRVSDDWCSKSSNTSKWIDEHLGSEFAQEHDLYLKVWKEKLRDKLEKIASLELAE